MKPTEKIEKLLETITVTPAPQKDRQMLNAILQAQAKSKQQSSVPPGPGKWRIIMKSKITKLTAAAIVLIAAVIALILSDKTVQTAYAIDQSIEAYNSIHWVQVLESQENLKFRMWIESDGHGNIKRMRLESDNVGDPVGPLVIVANLEHSESWMPRHNLRMLKLSDPSILIRYDIANLDPKFLFQRLFDQQKNGEAIVVINEPTETEKSIMITVTYPQGSKSEKWKQVFHIQPDTKLLTKIDKYEYRSRGYEVIKSLEFTNYNQPIEEAKFTLDNDVPADVKVNDMTGIEAGIPQGEMSDLEVAERLTREFFEAVINKNFSRASQLYLASPGFLVEKALMGANVLKITSIGPGYRDPEPDSNAIHCSCKVLAELDGLYHEFNVWMIRMMQIKSTNRWVICGTAATSSPAPDIVTLSWKGGDPNAVTYDGLNPGQFMQKWLILKPIPVEERKYVDAVRPSEQTQKDEFAANQIDTSQFQATVNIYGRDYEWAVLENKYGIIDLTGPFGELPLITYAWAQIDMPEEKQVTLGIGSDDGVKVWVNGELVHENWTCRGIDVDNDKVPVTFKKGMNQLVIKVQNQGGPWGFCYRVLEE